VNPLTWVARLFAARAFVKQLHASGYVSGSKAAGDAIVLATRLVEQDIPEAEAIARLQAMPGGQTALRNAAEMLARYAGHGYPLGPMYRLLRAASEEPTDPPSPEQIVAEARERHLREQPLAASFGELAGEVPELRQLDQRLRSNPGSLVNAVPLAAAGMPSEAPRTDSRIGRLLTVKALHEAVSQLVGPKSGQSDPVLASDAAWKVAFDYLREVGGIGLNS
jgi:hypothetical protein